MILLVEANQVLLRYNSGITLILLDDARCEKNNCFLLISICFP